MSFFALAQPTNGRLLRMKQSIVYTFTFAGCPNPITIYVAINLGQVSYFATAQPAATTQSACESLCTINPSCVSYQLDSNADRTSYCWLQTYLSAAGLTDQNNLFSRGNTVEYAKSTSCPGTYAADHGFEVLSNNKLFSFLCDCLFGL